MVIKAGAFSSDGITLYATGVNEIRTLLMIRDIVIFYEVFKILLNFQIVLNK